MNQSLKFSKSVTRCLLAQCALAAFFVAFPSPSQATTLVVPSTAQLVENSDAIVEGKVVSIKSGEENGTIYSYVVLKVRRVYRGEIEKNTEIVIRELGGRTEKTTLTIAGGTPYRKGANVIALLRQNNDGYFETELMGAGVRRLLKNKATGEELAVRDLNGADGLRIEGGKLARTPMRSFQRNYRETIERLAKKARRPATLKRAPAQLPASATVELTATGELESAHIHTADELSAQASLVYRPMGDPHRWEKKATTYYGANGDSKFGSEASRAMVQKSLSAWAGGSSNSPYTPDDIQPISGDGPGFRCAGAQGGLAISFNDPLKEITDPSACGGILGIGGYCGQSGTVNGYAPIAAAMYVLNNGWDKCSFWAEPNIAEVMTHELGHTLGFAHSKEKTEGACDSTNVYSDATMCWMAHFDGRGNSATTLLKEYDRFAIQHVYGGTATTPIDPPPPPPPPPAPSVKPVITQGPTNQAVAEGGSVTFRVTIIEDASATYLWQRNGKSIPGANAASYTFSPTRADDGSNYRVVVKNALGSTRSSAATLVVHFPGEHNLVLAADALKVAPASLAVGKRITLSAKLQNAGVRIESGVHLTFTVKQGANAIISGERVKPTLRPKAIFSAPWGVPWKPTAAGDYTAEVCATADSISGFQSCVTKNFSVK